MQTLTTENTQVRKICVEAGKYGQVGESVTRSIREFVPEAQFSSSIAGATIIITTDDEVVRKMIAEPNRVLIYGPNMEEKQIFLLAFDERIKQYSQEELDGLNVTVIPFSSLINRICAYLN